MRVAAIVADLLERAGVRHVFGVPGESYLPLLDEVAARPGLRFVTTRHESGAGFMADGYAKASGGIGVAMVSRGPGLLNLAIALHQAHQDASPVVAIAGQVGTPKRGRHAFQELAMARSLGPVVKWAVEVTRPERAAEAVAQALVVARLGRPGPVLVALPEDVLEADGGETVPALPAADPPVPHPERLEQALDWIERAERPVVVAGRGVLMAGASQALARFAEAFALPVYSAWRRMDVLPNDHPCYAGTLAFANDPEVVRPLEQADVVVGIGTQWNEVTSLGYRVPRERLVTVDVDPVSMAQAATRLPARECLALVADAGLFLRAALARGPRREVSGRHALVQACHARYERFSRPPESTGGPLTPTAVVAALRRLLPSEAAIVSDAGNFATWYQRYYRFRQPGTHFAPVSGAMGYGLPAAIGVALADGATGRWGPEGRPVVALAGDGGFLMTASELATAVRLALPVRALVFDNALYGTVYAHHRRRTDEPARLSVHGLLNPDFAALARAFGAYAETVERVDAVEPALRRALAAEGPAVLHVRVDPARLHALEG
ncbi:thiamine pyrophosphate-binding protein [Geochorda subterranea]|uniref:Thiamine pyrophosphate-binding protein n=1 Tax=Geochorda subterranea TaxID=3109564 RepID=A0ABZ1BRU5_9FIRM|nr:thiamine pyrophosphate-binding protein [Limnochorda sp. LNt]WRP14902.1 thiamine pyrophosphate-binding protein [Limnochorda sp. LNt]